MCAVCASGGGSSGGGAVWVVVGGCCLCGVVIGVCRISVHCDFWRLSL